MADVVNGGREINPLAVAGPAVELVGLIAPGEAAQIAGGEGEDVDVAATGARGDEGKLRAIGRVDGSRFRRWIGNEQMRFAAGCGDSPDIAARGKGDLMAVGRERRLGKRRLRSARAVRLGEGGRNGER